MVIITKLRRGILSVLFIALILVILSVSANVNAADRFLGLEKPRSSGYIYEANGSTVHKITAYTTAEGAGRNQNTTYYCLKAGPGFGSRDAWGEATGNEPQIRIYNQSFDLKNRSSIYAPYDSVIASGDNYNALIWVLEHCYIPELSTAASDKAALLQAAGITGSQLTDDDIDVVQQLAVWHFTNTETGSELYPNYSNLNVLPELFLTHLSNTNSKSKLSDISTTRADQAADLYDYLINGWADAGRPTPVQNNTTNPISISSSSSTVIEESGSYYIVGPYTISEHVSNVPYTLTSTLGNGIDHVILNSNKQQVSNLKDTVTGGQFYLRVASADYVSGAAFEVTATTSEKTVTYWSVTAANEAALSYDQPVAQVGNTPKTYKSQVIVKNKPNEKTFDLVLRKFITSINGVELKDTNGKFIKEPVVDVTPLINKTAKTAIYKHPKTPTSVAAGNEIIYTIRIYNEGDEGAHVTEIKDYLPENLEYVDDQFNTDNGWTISADGRIDTATVNKRLINPFENTMTTPDFVDIQIKCKVKDTANTAGAILTNIAEITGATDSTGAVKADEDSNVGNVTIPTGSDLENYRGKDTNKKDLTDSDYHYAGQEDDDDFDKLVLKSFDLSLKKFVTSIDGINVKNTTGDREPVITAQQIATLASNGTTTVVKNTSKTPLRVATGSTVVYTIRVYNEGEIDGKATEITDYLPTGLKLKENSTINTNNGWTNPSGDGKTIVTTKLANTVIAGFNGTEIKYADVQVECEVTTADNSSAVSLVNVAEITEAKDKDGNTVTDRDSTPGSLTEEQRNNYKPGTPVQDDDDGEELVVPAKELDLALRKFLTAKKPENGVVTPITGRVPVVDVTPLLTGGKGAEYKHQKSPIGVDIGDEVIYTIRVYNEGELAGYATEITDYLPKHLEYVNDEFNAKYGWSVSADGKTVKTTITSPNTSNSANRDEIYETRTTDTDKVLLKPFNGTTLDYIDVQIKCKVISVENSTSTVFTNIAEITALVDVNGNGTDRDSTVGNVTLPTTDAEWEDYKAGSGKSVLNDSNYYYKGQEDDDDFEKLNLQQFDLALRKFITGVNDTRVTNRTPVFTTDKDANGNYVYRQTKDPVSVETTDLVEYTIRVYNEGDLAGYAKEIKDNVPSGLEFVPADTVNVEYGWKMLDENGNETTNVEEAKSIVTDYLSKEQELSTGRNNLINEFAEGMATPDYKEVKVVFKVISTSGNDIVNIAEISKHSNENGDPVIDKDSTPDNNDPKEDDRDEEVVRLGQFDLALRKFITSVNTTAITNRYPVFKIDSNGNYVYEQTKDPVSVENGDTLIYTIRVYNEGSINGYAKEVKDNVPANLVFLPDNAVNTEYRWKMLDENGNETTDASKAVSIVTDYLSKAQADTTGRDNLLKAFNKNSMQEPNYKDIQVAFKVVDPKTADRVLINIAEISDDEDENGNPVSDKDSTPDNNNPEEDDQDNEKVKVKVFDLKLVKWTTQTIVIENGKEKVTETGHKPTDNPKKVVKVEIAKNKLNSVVVKFRYKIRVTNEGEIPGYVKEISEYVPEGLKFVAADNPDWQETSNSITTVKLQDKLLQPGESAEVDVLLTWNNSSDNMGQKNNTAEITKDENNSNTPDIDSTPGNKKPGEDDMDEAPVIITTKTGELVNLGYVLLAVASLGIITLGIVLIRKYILK